jgi:hypothetical protein
MFVRGRGPSYSRVPSDVSRLESGRTKKIVIEWRCSSGRIFIPFILSPNDDPEDYNELKDLAICHNSKRKTFWKSCVDHNSARTIPCHKLKRKTSNKKRKFLEDYEESLNEHFDELVKEAEPIATRYVREVTGETTLRDSKDDLVYLPSFFTVCNCYAKYCLEKRSLRITTNNKGNVIKVMKQYECL